MSDESRTPAWRRYTRFWGRNAAADIDDELRFHVEMRMREYIALGMTPPEARRLTEQRFGDATRARAECMAIDTTASRTRSRRETIADVGRDARYALRLLRRQWAAAVLAIVCLGLGIGATTTMFGVTNALLVRPLPFENGDRLYTVGEHVTSAGDAHVASYEDYVDWRVRQHSFVELAALGPTSLPVRLKQPVRANSGLVSANFFRTLGVTPIRGRLFAEGEDQPGAAPVAIVSRGFAERELGGVDGVIGTTVEVRGIARTVVGVVPDERVLPSGGELWLPFPRDLNHGRGNRNLDVIGWLAPNATSVQAQQEMTAIESQLAREYPSDDRGLSVSVTALRDRFVGPAKPTLEALIIATLLVLVVACANVAGIQLARATARMREIAVRSALGASRGRVIRQLLSESVLLSLAGGVLGVLIAYRASALAGRSILGLTPPWLEPKVDPRVLAFAVGASVLTGILFGIAPAWRLVRVDPSDVLRGGRAALGAVRPRLQQTLVAAQIALSIVLLVAAGLSVESVRQIQRIPLGFDPNGLLVFNVTLQDPHYDNDPPARVRFAAALVDRMRALPGATGAGATSLPPLRCCSQWQLHIDGRADGVEKLMVTGNAVTPGYFDAMRIPVMRGRAFEATDGAQATPVMVINETFATRYWPNENPLGQTVRDGFDHAVVVGVVKDVKQGGVLDAAEPQFYRPLAQRPVTTLTFALRMTRGDPAALTSAIRSIVHDLDPSLPMYNVSTMRRRVDEALLSRRTFEGLMLVFGAIALALAAIGVFAVTSFMVGERTRELGLRVALGAEPAHLLRLVLRGSAVLAMIGGIIGLGGAAAAARLLSHTLYGVRAGDPQVFIAAAVSLVLATLIASYGPARRASMADPMISLRAD